MAINKDKIRSAAQKHLQKGQIDKAIKEFQRLVADDPKDVRTLLKIGDLQTRNGNHKEATETYSNVAEFYSDQGFFLKAVAVYKQILKIDPTLIETNLKLAELYHQLGLLSDASNQYRQISQMYEKQGKIDESIGVLRRMVDLDPENVASRIKLAEIYAKQGMTDEARNEFRSAADFLKSHHRVDDYIKVGERIVHFDPSDLETTRELANIYVQKGDARRALAKLQVCFKADPTDAETLNLLANAFHELGQVPKTVSVYRELGRVYKKAGDREAHVGVMQKILDLVPDDAEARQALKESAAPEPLARAEAVETQAPQQIREITPELSTNEVEVEADLDELEVELEADAIEVTTTPVASQDDEAVVRILTEVDVYVKYGLKNKAVEHIQRIYEIDPANREAHERHKNLLVDMGETASAAKILWTMAKVAHERNDPATARGDLVELLGIDASHVEGRALLEQIAPDAGGVGAEIEVADVVEVEEEIAVQVDDEILLDDDVVVEEVSAPPLSYEPSPAAAEIDLDEDYSGPAAEIEAALAEEAIIVEDEPIEAEVVSGESALPETRARPSETMGANVPVLAETTTLSQSGSTSIEMDSPKPAAKPTAAAKSAAGEAGATDALVAELDELLASVPKARAKPEAAERKAVEPALEPDVEEPDLSEEIEEIEFFLQQGLEDEARDSLEALLIGYPDNAELIALKAKLDAATAEPEPEPVAVAADLDAEPEPETLQMETIDIAAELAQELDAVSDEDLQVSLADVFDDFKRGVAEQVDESDFQTHYDLGIAYKEMGLLDDALREFNVAVNGAPQMIAARTMVGLLQLELGNIAGALDHFLKGLNSENVTAGEALALRFEIGLAYEAMDRFGEAKKFYEKVHAMDAKYRDVATRLAEANRQNAETVDISDELDALLTDTDAEKTSRDQKADKISYV